MQAELKATWTPAINVLTFFMLVTSILSVFTRLGTKYFMVRKWGLDDFFSIGAMVTCVGQSIAVSMATKSGLGQHLVSLSRAQELSMMKVSVTKCPRRESRGHFSILMFFVGFSRLNMPQTSFSSPAWLAPNSRS